MRLFANLLAFMLLLAASVPALAGNGSRASATVSVGVRIQEPVVAVPVYVNANRLSLTKSVDGAPTKTGTDSAGFQVTLDTTSSSTPNTALVVYE